jgi:hypothetical protein
MFKFLRKVFVMSDINDQANDQQNVSDKQSTCDGGSCCCPSSSGGGGKGFKMVVFIVVVVAAISVLAHSLANKSKSDSDQSQQGFPAIQIDGAASAAASLWKADLDSMDSLVKVAANDDTVLILVTAKEQANIETITKEIESAAKKIMSEKNKVSAFRLKDSAPEYANIINQASTPCVMVMVKGLKMRIVSKDITEAKLLTAFVEASRPSTCCPSGGCDTAPAKPDPK